MGKHSDKLNSTMKQIIFLCVVILLLSSCKVKKNSCKCLEYNNPSKMELYADSLKRVGDLKTAILVYKTEYAIKPNKRTAYSLAYSYSLMWDMDSSLYYLKKATLCDSSIYRIYDASLFPLINTNEWKTFANRQMDKFEINHGKFGNRDLVNKLMLIRMKDQAYYWHAFTKPDSAAVYWAKKIELNKENVLEIKKIIKTYGWPTRKLVGIDALSVVFLVLQHSGDYEFVKEMRPQLKQLAESDSLFLPQYALLDDRINVREGKKQLYGSQPSYDSIKQVYYLDNVVSPDSLDIRRKKMGLNPIKEYLKQWNAELRIYD